MAVREGKDGLYDQDSLEGQESQDEGADEHDSDVQPGFEGKTEEDDYEDGLESESSENDRVETSRDSIERSDQWPNNPEEMDQRLDMEGRRVPDSPDTPGRNKVEWRPATDVKIVYEEHPYHSDAPDWHKGPHWHIDYPGTQHKRKLPGDPS